MSAKRLVSRTVAQTLALLALLAALPYAPDAQARGGRRFGFFIGGAVVGAVLAPRYVYAAPYYYPPPVAYYPPYPAVTYVSPPPVVVQQVAPAPVQSIAPAPAQALSIEDRLHRLRSLCEQGLFTESECHTRREQILQEM